jgi:hypothetical protein
LQRHEIMMLPPNPEPIMITSKSYFAVMKSGLTVIS